MIYSFARIGAVVAMKVDDYYPGNKRWWVRLHEKGGKRHEMPAHHKLEAFIDEYLAAAGIREDGKSLLFRSEPADVQPARNAGGQRAFLRGAAGVIVEAGLRDLPERLTFDRLPVPERIGPEVFFSQTYGYPLALVDYTRLGLRDKGALPSLEANS